MRGIKTRLIIFWLLCDKRLLSHKLRSKVMRDHPQPQHHHHHHQHSITNVVGLVIDAEKKHMYFDPEEEEKDEEDQYPPGDLDHIMHPEEEEEKEKDEDQYAPGDLDHIMYPEEEEKEEEDPILEWVRNTKEVKGQKFRLDHHNIDQAADLFITRFHRQLRTQNSHHNPNPQRSV